MQLLRFPCFSELVCRFTVPINGQLSTTLCLSLTHHQAFHGKGEGHARNDEGCICIGAFSKEQFISPPKVIGTNIQVPTFNDSALITRSGAHDPICPAPLRLFSSAAAAARRIKEVVSVSHLPLIADADTGFGEAGVDGAAAGSGVEGEGPGVGSIVLYWKGRVD